MDDRQTAWEEIGGRVPAGTVSQLTPPKAGSIAAWAPPSADPVSETDFIIALTPCLALVAPVGMGQQDRDIWFDAAYLALGHLPADILREGAREAMRSADHPSKIVPAIIGATKARLHTRQALNAVTDKYRALPAPDRDNRPPEERAKVAQTLGALVKKMVATAPDVDAVLGKKASLSD
jgi:hypothetical protein